MLRRVKIFFWAAAVREAEAGLLHGDKEASLTYRYFRYKLHLATK